MDGSLELVRAWTNDVLVWIGFGTLVGLAAKAIMPGRDPGGTVATLGMGIGGTIFGCGAFSFFIVGHRITPISPVGALVATAGAVGVLFLYRLLAGYLFTEGETSLQWHNVARKVGQRRRKRQAA